MIVGITGHQERPGIDWAWVGEVIRGELAPIPVPLVGLSSLARGADQVFAEVLLQVGGRLHFVVPTEDYERHFAGDHLQRFSRLKASAAEVINISPMPTDEDAFLAAGEYIASHSDLLMSVWDGKPAAGRGGTADVVAFAKRRCTAILHINPMDKEVRPL